MHAFTVVALLGVVLFVVLVMAVRAAARGQHRGSSVVHADAWVVWAAVAVATSVAHRAARTNHGAKLMLWARPAFLALIRVTGGVLVARRSAAAPCRTWAKAPTAAARLWA